MHFTAGEFSVKVTVPDGATLLSQVHECLEAREGFAIATLNLDHLVKLAKCDRFRAAYRAQDMVTADGNPIVWMSRLARQPVELIPGSDMILPLSRVAARRGVGIALVGSTAEALETAAKHLEGAVDGLRVVARIAPPMNFDPANASGVFAELERSGAGLTFVALGAPKQELFAAAGRARLPEMGFASIGAGLDFFSGRQSRAPRWVRRLALEWLWRMGSSPRRLTPRYLRCVLILPVQACRAVAMGRRVRRA